MTATTSSAAYAPVQGPHLFSTEDAECNMIEDLDAYFKACEASSSISSSSSSADHSDAEEEEGKADSNSNAGNKRLSRLRSNPGPGDSFAQRSPLQGSAPRPLLPRHRHVSVGGADATSPLYGPAAAPLVVSLTSANTKSILAAPSIVPSVATQSTTGTARSASAKPASIARTVAPPTRGAAGDDLAHKLQCAALPFAKTETMWDFSRATNVSAVFKFHSPPTFSSVRGKRASTPTQTRTKNTLTITTRGRSTRSPSSPSDDTRVQQHARQRAVLFDVLCALRQHPTSSCGEAEAPQAEQTAQRNDEEDKTLEFTAKTWRLRESVRREAFAQQWPSCFLGSLEQLLEVANIVAAVEAQVNLFARVSAAFDESRSASSASDAVGVQDAVSALESAGQKTLQRLSCVLRQLNADFMQWVLQAQEFLITVCEEAFVSGEGNHSHSTQQQQRALPSHKAFYSPQFDNGEERMTALQHFPLPFSPTGVPLSRDERCLHSQSSTADAGNAATAVAHDRILPLSYSLVDIVLAVQENSIPLRRCRVLVDSSGCFDGLTTMLSKLEQQQVAREGAEPSSTPANSCANVSSSVSFALLAARLLDTLIIQASAVQDTSTMDLYRFYVMLLLYTSWPYVQLCTAAIFGFVRGIDPPVWRLQLPRLFRSSFSHVRIGDAHRHYPTDVLSLLLNCVGYYNSVEVLSDTSGRQESSQGIATASGITSPAVADSAASQFPQPRWEPVGDHPGGGIGNNNNNKGTHHHHTNGSQNHGGRHRDIPEQHVALAALASARTFVLRSLASFTRRKRQIALSRTPARMGAVGPLKKARQERNSNGSNGAGIRGDERASPRSSASRQNWQNKSVKEILRYIMYESGGLENDDAGEEEDEGQRAQQAEATQDKAVERSATAVQSRSAGAAVLAYAQENQDVRRRIVRLPDASTTAASATSGNDGVAALARLTSDGKHFRYYPTTIPLGFATMTREFLPGQQLWEEQREDRTEQLTAADANTTTPAHLLSSAASTSFLPSSAPRWPPQFDARYARSSSASECGENDLDNAESGQRNPLYRRTLPVWTLFISESATAPDVLFADANAPLHDEELHGCGRGCTALFGFVSENMSDFSPSGLTRRKRAHQLWINITIPCARWVTTALLIPIGVAVQRLQERRLRDLFATSLHASGPFGFSPVCNVDGNGGRTGLLWRNDEESDVIEDVSKSSRHTFAGPFTASSSYNCKGLSGVMGVVAPLRRMSPSTTTTTAACSFLHALKLLIDVALCRDQERLVFTFLERLYHEPRWWARRWVDGGMGAFDSLGTASPIVSALFADALRGKRLGELVRLVVLPSRETRKERPSTSVSTNAVNHATTAAAQSATPAFSISRDILDMFASFQLAFTFPGAFALILQPRDLSVYVHPVTNAIERSYQTFFWQRRRRLYVEEPATTLSPAAAAAAGVEAPTAIKNGIAFADVWSYIFGYQCSLYYAQITLREHKKQLHQRDTQDFQVAQTMGQVGPQVTRHLQYVSRGLGSAYYTLNFAVDTLLSFTQGEAMRTVYDLERLLHKAMRLSPGLHSCMELSYKLDTLLLQLHFVTFSARPAVAQNARERAMQSPAMEAVRSAVQRILEVALDPSRLPVSYISSTTRNSVEALVAAVTAAEERQSVLASRLHPLRILLTFNKYYGSPEETLSYRFR